jgi:hypothetical protein
MFRPLLQSFYDLDHTRADVLNQGKEPILTNRHTNWDDFRCLINERLSLNITLKTEEDTEAAAKFFNDKI